ncbi:MAG: hypothetical protein MdMp014T_0041 [Treponematales bacterium]
MRGAGEPRWLIAPPSTLRPSDGPRKLPKKPAAPAFSLDYANSEDAGEIDAGIRETIKGIRLSILAMGIGLAKIKAKELYLDLNYHSMPIRRGVRRRRRDVFPFGNPCRGESGLYREQAGGNPVRGT